jgi:hypothetical protein
MKCTNRQTYPRPGGASEKNAPGGGAKFAAPYDLSSSKRQKDEHWQEGGTTKISVEK